MKESFNKILKAGIVAGAITIPIESIADSIKDSNINNPPKEPTEQVDENIDSLNITPEQDYQAKLAEWERVNNPIIKKYQKDSLKYEKESKKFNDFLKKFHLEGDEAQSVFTANVAGNKENKVQVLNWYTVVVLQLDKSVKPELFSEIKGLPKPEIPKGEEYTKFFEKSSIYEYILNAGNLFDSKKDGYGFISAVDSNEILGNLTISMNYVSSALSNMHYSLKKFLKGEKGPVIVNCPNGLQQIKMKYEDGEPDLSTEANYYVIKTLPIPLSIKETMALFKKHKVSYPVYLTSYFNSSGGSKMKEMQHSLLKLPPFPGDKPTPPILPLKPEKPTITPKPEIKKTQESSLHFKPASLAAARFKIGDSGNLESHLPYNINTVIGTIVNEKGKTTEMTVKDYIELTKGKTEEQKAQMFGVNMDWWDEMIGKAGF